MAPIGRQAQNYEMNGDLGLGIQLIPTDHAATFCMSETGHIPSSTSSLSSTSLIGDVSDLSSTSSISLPELGPGTAIGQQDLLDPKPPGHSSIPIIRSIFPESSQVEIDTSTTRRQELPLASPRRPSLDRLQVSSSSVNGMRRSASLQGHLRQYSKDLSDILDVEVVSTLRHWIVSFAVVDFDLDFGQKLEYTYPSFHFSEVEKKNIAFSSFPDRTVGESSTLVYSFRTRASSSISSPSPRRDYGPLSPSLEGIERASSLDGFWYCGVVFRQKRDPSRRRGFFLKSFVVISHLPYIGLLEKLAHMIGSQYFKDTGTTARTLLESAVRDMAEWPSPKPSAVYALPLLGEIIPVELPPSLFGGKPQISTLSIGKSDTEVLGLGQSKSVFASRPDCQLLSLFGKVLPHLWTIWELVLMGEPLLIYANNPRIASDAVWACLELIKPIAYCGDYRPYLTLQDADLGRFVGRRVPSEPLIVGVTNPYFLTACDNWPNILRLDGSGTEDLKCHGTRPSKSLPSELRTIYRRMISRDRAILNRMQNALQQTLVDKDMRSLEEELRRHFATLTERILAPLNRYYATLLPRDTSLSTASLRRAPTIKPFRHDHFLRSLAQHGPSTSFKPRPSASTGFTAGYGRNAMAQAFYSKWILCGNFASWLEGRSNETQSAIAKKRVQLLCDLDIDTWLIQAKDGSEAATVLHAALQFELDSGRSESDNGTSVYDLSLSPSSPSHKPTASNYSSQHSRSTSSPIPHSPTQLSDESASFFVKMPPFKTGRHQRATSTTHHNPWSKVTSDATGSTGVAPYIFNRARILSRGEMRRLRGQISHLEALLSESRMANLRV